MSLRDQLLKAGLVSKKDARKAKQAKRKEAKRKEGNLEKKRLRQAKQAQEAAQAAERVRKQKLADRRAREAVRDRYERALRVRQLIRAHEMRSGGPVRFFHRARNGQIGVLQVSSGVANMLRRGQVAVAAEDQGNDKVRYALIPAHMAELLQELMPGVVVHWTRGDEQEVIDARRDWEPDLRARRASPQDIERLRARAREQS